MTRESFRRVLEFYQHSGRDVSGQATPEECARLEARISKFLRRTLPSEERAALFQDLKLNPEFIELLARKIQMRFPTGTAKAARGKLQGRN